MSGLANCLAESDRLIRSRNHPADQTDEARLDTFLFGRAEGSSGPKLGMGKHATPSQAGRRFPLSSLLSFCIIIRRINRACLVLVYYYWDVLGGGGFYHYY